jgi:hypothetical protein
MNTPGWIKQFRKLQSDSLKGLFGWDSAMQTARILAVEKEEFCKHWKELDDDNGNYEYCRGKQRRCGCCATKSQCNFPEYFKAIERR